MIKPVALPDGCLGPQRALPSSNCHQCFPALYDEPARMGFEGGIPKGRTYEHLDHMPGPKLPTRKFKGRNLSTNYLETPISD